MELELIKGMIKIVLGDLQMTAKQLDVMKENVYLAAVPEPRLLLAMRLRLQFAPQEINTQIVEVNVIFSPEHLELIIQAELKVLQMLLAQLAQLEDKYKQEQPLVC